MRLLTAALAVLVSAGTAQADLRKAKIDFQYELYSGADHGFSTPQNAAEERANAQSIASSTRYLKELFGR